MNINKKPSQNGGAFLFLNNLTLMNLHVFMKYE